MLFYTGLLFLVIAVSLDGFGVGMTYGMRKIHVPILALLIIMFCSGTIVLLSMTIGSTLSSFISPQTAKAFGGIILIFLGAFSLFNIFRSPKEVREESNQPNKMHVLKSILDTPDYADLDRSGTISANEAFLLGAALALDAFGAGIGASMLGYSPILTTAFVAIMSGAFLYCGIRVGFLLANAYYMQHLTLIPPLLLITLGVINLY